MPPGSAEGLAGAARPVRGQAPESAERHGLTSMHRVTFVPQGLSCDVPAGVTLAEAAEQGRIKPGDHVLLVAFGAGLAWATAIIQWGAAASQQQSGLQRFWRQLRARVTTLTLRARLALYELNNRLRHKK